MKSAAASLARIACRLRREDDLRITFAVFVVCFVLFAR
jgi:hypothetical protein